MRFIRIARAIVPLLLLAACTTEEPARPAVTGGAQPGAATYRCGEDGTILIENAGASVRVTEATRDKKNPDGAPRDPVELAAAPPNQRSRYGLDGYALVIEGREALWMRAGATPKTCLR